MSFLLNSPTNHHHPHIHHQHHPQQQSMPSTPSFDCYHHQQPFPHDHQSVVLPKIGQTRCYWALLTSELQFIYLDPVLASHLEEQADVLLGKSLLSFVHPDEQASAKHDLGDVLENRTLHGSVTRVRFSRLSRVRRQLGYQGPGTPWSDAEKIALDSNYMAVDIVINWAAEGLVLCFIHAIVDLDPSDNDEHNKTNWTNWCGTPYMPTQQVQLLFSRLLNCVPQTGSVSRVFQILSNQPARQMLISWPPDQGQGPSGRDFAKLVENVQIGADLPNSSDAKTSCTRRYKATQHMPAFPGSDVESIYIPHGTVIFACHKFTPSKGTPTPSMQIPYPSSGYSPQSATPQPPYYEQNNSFALPPLSNYNNSNSNNYMPQQSPQPVSSPYSPQRWPPSSGPTYSQWGSSSPTHSIASLPPSVSNLRSGSVSYQTSPQAPPQQWPPPPGSAAAFQENTSPVSAGTPYDRPLSPYSPYAASPAGGSEGGGNGSEGGGGGSPGADVVPPPRRRVSPGSTRDQYPPGGRSAGNRPVGISRCSSCKTTTSPEWRKGPSGKKELCNACGLRYARSRAKKEGHNSNQRRRKDKVLGGVTKHRDSATPPIPSSAGGSPSAYSTVGSRRGWEDASFVSTGSVGSTGSGSGSEMYHPSPSSRVGHGLEEMTPSPSPPASSVSFVHYSPGGGSPPVGAGDQHHPGRSSGGFYSVPSPLSNPPVVGSQPQGGGGHHQLPRLDYVERLSPMLGGGESPGGSSIGSGMGRLGGGGGGGGGGNGDIGVGGGLPSSFERGRQLPPMPVPSSVDGAASGGPRQMARRGILTGQ